jgi:hypothetical protein
MPLRETLAGLACAACSNSEAINSWLASSTVHLPSWIRTLVGSGGFSQRNPRHFKFESDGAPTSGNQNPPVGTTMSP